MKGKVGLLILLALGQQLRAASGIIQALDGKRIEGEIHLEENGIHVSNTNQEEASIDLTNLALLRIQAPLPPGAASLLNEVPGLVTSISTKPKMPAGILLATGTLLARKISSADETAVRFFDGTNEIVLSRANVARILFQPWAEGMESRLQSGKAGLLLSTREFVEGDFKGFSEGRIQMVSVLYGMTTYDPGRVIAVILREPKLCHARYELKTRDDSCLLVDSVRIEKDRFVLEDGPLRGLAIALPEIVELRRKMSGGLLSRGAD